MVSHDEGRRLVRTPLFTFFVLRAVILSATDDGNTDSPKSGIRTPHSQNKTFNWIKS